MIKAEVIKWSDNLYSVSPTVRTGSLETGNHNSAKNAKRAFVSMCNRLGVKRSKYEFENLTKSKD